MTAQIDSQNLIWIVIGTFGAIGGAYMFLFRHLANSKKHPNKDDIVFRDVCEKTQQVIHTEIKGQRDLVELKFTEVKTDLGEIKDLIKNNGQSSPRIQT